MARILKAFEYGIHFFANLPNKPVRIRAAALALPLKQRNVWFRADQAQL
jgi:hypothetical protein